MEKVFFELLRLAIEDGQRLTVNGQQTTDFGQRSSDNFVDFFEC